MAQAQIEALYRFPVKGLSGESLERAEVTAGHCLPGDRAYAIEHSGSMFDPANPRHLPKIRFLMLMRHERLAMLATEYSEADETLTVKRDGKTVARGALNTLVGRQILEQFFSAFMADDIRGTPHIVSAPGHHFTDVSSPWLSLISLATVRDLERVIGAPVDPLRFRGNILIDGLEPWQEFQWVGGDIRASGGPEFHVVQAITRCAATEVDPATGARDLMIRKTLENSFGHVELGVYLEATGDGPLVVGDTLRPVAEAG